MSETKEETGSTNGKHTSSNTSENTAMNPVDSIPDAFLPENCDIEDAGTTTLEENPVYEIYTGGDITASEEQLEEVNAEIDKLVAEYTRGTHQTDGDEDAGSTHHSDVKRETCLDQKIDDDSILENEDDIDSDEDDDTDVKGSSPIDDPGKEEPKLDDFSENADGGGINTSVEEGANTDTVACSADTYDPARTMHLAAVVASNLTPKPEPSGPSHSTASQTAVKKRIDVLSLPVVENPLQKEGRHTVISGRLPDEHPFLIAAKNLGHKMVSKKLGGYCEMHDAESRRDMFHKDLREFLKEIHSKNTKLPIIGGGNLDLYGLMKEVLLLGGVENVVKKRAFRIVAQQLELPKSCTSAAYVLKGAYEKFLYFYETRLVFGTWPDNAGRRVDMKTRVIEQKQQEKLANQVNGNGGRKRRRGEISSSKSGAKKRALEMDSRILQMLSTISNDAQATHRYLKVMSTESGERFVLPEWALQVPEDGSYLEIVERIQRLDESNKVRTSGEVILLAMAECFQLLSPTGSPLNPIRTRDLGLAKAICLLPTSAPVTRKAQACLFSLLVQATKLPATAVLSPNQSAKGLLDGIFSLIQIYHTRNHDKPVSETIPFINSRNHVINRDAAAAYCGLRIVGNLSKEPRNRCVISVHPGVGKVLLPLCKMKGLYRDFVVTVLDILQDICSAISKNMVEALVDAVLPKLEKACMDDIPDYDVSTRGLNVVSVALESLPQNTDIVTRVISLTCRILNCQISIVNTSALGVIVNCLIERFPEIVSGESGFVDGCFGLLRDGRCTSLVAESLCQLHRTTPLHEFAGRAGLGISDVAEEVHSAVGIGSEMEKFGDEFEV